MSKKVRVLILCTANSARSQMAEGLLRADRGDEFEVESAGTRATLVRPEAIAAMAEIGVDLTAHRSKTVDEFAGQSFDYVLTVCDNANENCPVYPGHGVRMHRNFEDPAVGGIEAFRRVRDQLRRYLAPPFPAQVRVRAAESADLPAVATLLASCELVPVNGLNEGFAVAIDSGAVAGVAGVEVYGATDGLLRSVAVEPAWRSRGVAAALVEDRLRWARRAGLDALYLLTTTAADYWVRHGFETIDRTDAPPAIAASHEWKSACPASATAMRLRFTR